MRERTLKEFDGTWLKEALTLYGRSQSDLARYLNISQSAVNRIVNNKRQLKLRELAGLEIYLRITHPDHAASESAEARLAAGFAEPEIEKVQIPPGAPYRPDGHSFLEALAADLLDGLDAGLWPKLSQSGREALRDRDGDSLLARAGLARALSVITDAESQAIADLHELLLFPYMPWANRDADIISTRYAMDLFWKIREREPDETLYHPAFIRSTFAAYFFGIVVRIFDALSSEEQHGDISKSSVHRSTSPSDE